MVTEGLCDLADAHRGAEQTVAGGCNLGVQDKTLGGGAEVTAEAAFEGTDRHAGLAGEFVDTESLLDVVVDEVDELGEGAVGGRERVAFSLIKATGDSGGAHEFAFETEEGNLGSHAPLDSAGAARDQFHLVEE